MDTTDLSICMIVKNEEHCIRRCLDSVRPLRAELIVVDTGSTDATPAIAAGYGADVTTFDFSRPDFSAARNHSLGRANARWIMVIDADETLRPSSVSLVQAIAACSENVACCVRRHNHSPGVSNSSVDNYIRIFPNRPEYRFKYRVHESVDASIPAGGGVIVRTDVCTDHDFASDLESRRRKNLWYMGIMEEEIRADPSDLSRHRMLAVCYHDLGMFDRAAALTERIVRVWPMDASAHFDAGVCYLFYGKSDPARARSEFEESLRLQPGNPTVMEYLRALEMSALLGIDARELVFQFGAGSAVVR
jgi:glycosyltransferase involved in cell wall biosynthesis